MMFSTPSERSSARVAAVPSLTVSSRYTAPANTPSMATHTSEESAAASGTVTPREASNVREPTKTSASPTRPTSPCGTTRRSVASGTEPGGRDAAAPHIATARGCELPASTAAAMARTRSPPVTSDTEKRPVVSVPVLSSTRVSTDRSESR